MDGTLLCSTGMWDHVTDRILAKYGKTITHEQRMGNMTLTVEGTAAMFVQQLGEMCIRDRARLTPKSLPGSAFIPSGICCCTIRGGILIIPSRTR